MAKCPQHDMNDSSIGSIIKEFFSWFWGKGLSIPCPSCPAKLDRCDDEAFRCPRCNKKYRLQLEEIPEYPVSCRTPPPIPSCLAICITEPQHDWTNTKSGDALSTVFETLMEEVSVWYAIVSPTDTPPIQDGEAKNQEGKEKGSIALLLSSNTKYQDVFGKDVLSHYGVERVLGEVKDRVIITDWAEVHYDFISTSGFDFKKG